MTYPTETLRVHWYGPNGVEQSHVCQSQAEADAWFAAAGTFTLSEIRRRYWRKYFQILKRGAIRSETEFDLVKGIVEGGGIEPGAKEEAKLRAMVAQYEARLVASLARDATKPPAAP